MDNDKVMECTRVEFDHDKHPYVLLVMTLSSVLYALASCVIGTFMMQITSSGLPYLLEACLLLLLCVASFIHDINSTNMFGFRHAWPNDVLTEMCGVIVSALIGGLFSLMISNARKVLLEFQGFPTFPRFEFRLHVAMFTMSVAPNFVVFIAYLFLLQRHISVYTVFRLRQISYVWTSIVIFCSSIGCLLLLQWLRRRNYTTVYQIVRDSNLVICYLGIPGSLGFGFTNITSKLPPLESACLTGEDQGQAVIPWVINMVIQTFVKCGFFIGAYRYRQRLKSRGVVVEFTQRTTWRYRLSILAVLLGGVVIPQVIGSFEAMRIFLLIQMFLVCMVYVSWLVSQRSSEEDLEDWCVAAVLKKREREEKRGIMIANFAHFAPWAIDLCTTSFLLISLVSTPVIPWNLSTGMYELNVFGFLSFSDKLTPFAGVLSVSAVFFISLYYIDAIHSFLIRLFPRLNSGSSRFVTAPVRFLLYKPLLLVGLRLVLSGSSCSTLAEINDQPTDGGAAKETLNIDETVVCDGFGWHRLSVFLSLNAATWCLVLQALNFSRDFLFTKKPGMTQNPKGSIVMAFSRIVVVMMMEVVQGEIMVAVGVLIVIGVMIWVHQCPLVLGSPKANAIQLSAAACVVTIHLSGLVNFAAPHQWFPFIIMLICLPIVALGAYKFGFAHRKTKDSDARIEGRVERLYQYDYTIIQDENKDAALGLNARDLGAAFHTLAFQTYLWDTLRKDKERDLDQVLPSEKGGTEEKEDPAALVALTRFSHALSVDCGQRALVFHPEFIPLLSPFLSHPYEQIPAMEVVSRISLIPWTLPLLRKHVLWALMQAWCEAKSVEIHRQGSQILERIKGGDKIILYSYSSSNSTITNIHKELGGKMLKVTVVRHDVWLVPYDIDAPFNYYTTIDPIDALLSFPPHLPFPKVLLRGRRRAYPGLCIPAPDFTAFETLIEMKDRKPKASLLRRMSTFVDKLKPKTRKSAAIMNEDESLGDEQPSSIKRVKDVWILYRTENLDEEAPGTHITKLRESLSSFYTGNLEKW